MIYQAIEGTLVSRLGWGTASAQPLTIAFWAQHNRVGTYSVSVRNAALTRSYVASYTQNVSNAVEFKTITIPGCTDGVWTVDTTVGIWLMLMQSAGANYIAPTANAWINGDFTTAPGQVNGSASTGDACRYGGVIVVPGNEAPQSSRLSLVLRPAAQELLICNRYFQFVSASARAAASSSFQMFDTNINFPIHMRAAPTVSINSAAPSQSNVNGTPTIAIVDGYACRYEVVSAAAGDVYSIGAIIKCDARI
jgi:hypothetical protein